MAAERLVVRAATEVDLAALEDLYRAFAREIPPPAYLELHLERELQEVAEYLRSHVALIATGDDSLRGFVLARMRGPRHARISDLYVVPDARRSGIARSLLREATALMMARGAEAIELDVAASNEEARAVYERWGFTESLVRLAAPAGELEERLSRDAPSPSLGLVFVQSDDTPRIEQAVRSYLPRLGRSSRTDVRSPVNGWIAVDDELCSGDPDLLQRLAQELSYRTGGVVLALGVEGGAVVRYVLFDRGSVADEYSSVPEYSGPLPPGDVVGLSANPTVAHRLTGADPARVRAVARTASSPAELPPAEELVVEIASVLGVPFP
jgi:ribosomal protein S18 acetylase RimI-like enzyme